MFIPRLQGDDIKSSKYYNRPYSTGDMPNCTTYALFRACELLGRQICQNLGGVHITDPCFNRDGYGNACDWYRDWVWEKGQTPCLAAIACWSGTYKDTGKVCAGHVAVVEQIFSDGSFLTSNSNYGGTWFYTQKIPANKELTSSKYNFKFEGFCYIPLTIVERDTTKHQAKVVVDGLRLRTEPNTYADISAIVPNGCLFNVREAKNEDYRWLDVEEGWIATKPEWIEEYLPVQDEIDELKATIKEQNKTISTLKDMNNALDVQNKKLQAKLDKIGGILNE